MEYPKELVEEVRKRSKGFKLEGFLSGQGKMNPPLMIVGEAPGRKEITSHVPFSGQAGKELMKSLEIAHLTRDDVYITSVVRSRPYSIKQVKNKKTGEIEVKRPNRTPTKKEVLAFAPLFDWELTQVDPKIIVTVGNTSLQRILGPKYNVGNSHGKVFEQKIQRLNEEGDGYCLTKRKYKVISTFHPAAIFYNRKLTSEIQADWELISDVLHEGYNTDN